MSSLRNKIIRLAHAKPELRKHLLPILKEAIGAYYDGLNRSQKKLLDNYLRQKGSIEYDFDELPIRLQRKLYELDDLADEFRNTNLHYQLEESVYVYLRENDTRSRNTAWDD